MTLIAPTIETNGINQPLIATLGRPLTISVRIKADPKPNVKWQIGRKKVKESAKYKLKNDDGKRKYELIISKVTEDLNEGVWVVATNEAGEDCCHIIIQTMARSPSYVDISNHSLTITSNEINRDENDNTIKITQKYKKIKHKRSVSTTEITVEDLNKHLDTDKYAITDSSNHTLPKDKKVTNNFECSPYSSAAVSETNLDDPYIRPPKKSVKSKNRSKQNLSESSTDVNKIKDVNNNVEPVKKNISIKKPVSNGVEIVDTDHQIDDSNIKTNTKRNKVIETDLDKVGKTSEDKNKDKDFDDENADINDKHDILWEIYGKNVIELCNEILDNYDFSYDEDNKNKKENGRTDEKTDEMASKGKDESKKVNKNITDNKNITSYDQKNILTDHNENTNKKKNVLDNKLPSSFSNTKVNIDRNKEPLHPTPKVTDTQKKGDPNNQEAKDNKQENEEVKDDQPMTVITSPKNDGNVTILKGDDGKPKFYLNKIDNVPIVPNPALVMPKREFKFKPTNSNISPFITSKPPPHLPSNTGKAGDKPNVLTTYVMHKKYPSYRNLIEANMNISTAKKQMPKQYPNTPRQQKKLDRNRSRSADLLNRKDGEDDDNHEENAQSSYDEHSWGESNTLPGRPKSTGSFPKTNLLPSRSEEILVIRGSRLKPFKFDDSGSKNDLFRSFQSLNTDSENGSISSKMGKRTMSREWERVIVTTTEETFVLPKEDQTKTKGNVSKVEQPIKISTETSTIDLPSLKPIVTKVEKGTEPDRTNGDSIDRKKKTVESFTTTDIPTNKTDFSQTPTVTTADKNVGHGVFQFVNIGVGSDENFKEEKKPKPVTLDIGIGTDPNKTIKMGKASEAKPSTGFSSQQTEPVIISQYPKRQNDGFTQTDGSKNINDDQNVIPVTVTTEYPVINFIPVKEDVKPEEHITTAQSYEFGEIIVFYNENSEKFKEYAKLRKKELKNNLHPLFSLDYLSREGKTSNLMETNYSKDEANTSLDGTEIIRFETLPQLEMSKTNNLQNNQDIFKPAVNKDLNSLSMHPLNFEPNGKIKQQNETTLDYLKEPPPNLNKTESITDLIDFSTDDDLLSSRNISFFNPLTPLIENNDLKPSLRYNSNTFTSQNKKPDLLLADFDSKNMNEQNDLDLMADNLSIEIVEEMINSLNNGSNVSIHHNSYDKIIESVNKNQNNNKFYGPTNNFTWDFLNSQQSQAMKKIMRLSPINDKQINVTNTNTETYKDISEDDSGDPVDNDDQKKVSRLNIEIKAGKVLVDERNSENSPRFPDSHRDMIQEKEKLFSTFSYLSLFVLLIATIIFFILRNFTETGFLHS